MKQEDVGKVIDRSFKAQSFIDTHARRITDHYLHAREKHPYFCDDLLPELEHEEMRRHTKNVLTSIRKNLEGRARAGHVEWDNLLNCEVWEVFDAIANNDKAQAIEELYDCVAVCLRTIDVMEGRQKLGNPESQTNNNKENENGNQETGC